MINVKVNCDRCKQWIYGGFDDHSQYTCTAGYYSYVGWSKFMDIGERTVCDECMHKDERYIKIYGKLS